MAVEVPKLEVGIGIDVYASNGRGIDGKIRHFPEDFIVEEILIDGSKASIQIEKEGIPPSERGRYLICVLIKKGWDTLVATRKIANCIGVNPERIRIAGIKDTRALTAQHISIGGISPDRMLKVNLEGMILRPNRFSDEEISSSLLFGNQFTILTRSIKYCSSTVQRRIEKIKNELTDLGGTPNFFGHQRFGTVRPVTHKVGYYLVKGDFENAALVFLSQPSPYEHPRARNARRELRDTQDFKMAFKYFPRKLMYERLMLSHLSKYPKDFLGALRRLPPNLCKLFVQAYQSFLFNKFLSQRIMQGLPLCKAQLGDYVVELDERGLPKNSFNEVESHNISRINEEISKGNMAVAIPLIGFKQSYSRGKQGEIEKEILENEEISPQDFNLQKMPEASAPGGLRRVLAPVIDLNIEEEDDPDGPRGFRIKFGFTLHKGSYATVLLREFMKPKNLIKAGF